MGDPEVTPVATGTNGSSVCSSPDSRLSTRDCAGVGPRAAVGWACRRLSLLSPLEPS